LIGITELNNNINGQLTLGLEKFVTLALINHLFKTLECFREVMWKQEFM